jgi:hypothetical protein
VGLKCWALSEQEACRCHRQAPSNVVDSRASCIVLNMQSCILLDLELPISVASNSFLQLQTNSRYSKYVCCMQVARILPGPAGKLQQLAAAGALQQATPEALGLRDCGSTSTNTSDNTFALDVCFQSAVWCSAHEFTVQQEARAGAWSYWICALHSSCSGGLSWPSRKQTCSAIAGRTAWKHTVHCYHHVCVCS